MTQFNEYHLNPKNYNFLRIFKQNWQEIRAEYFTYLNDTTYHDIATKRIMTPQSKTLVSKQGNDFEAASLRFHGKNLLQVIEDNKLQWPNVSTTRAITIVSNIFAKHFTETQNCINQADKLSQYGIRNVYFSVLKPGLDVKCHINYNPHIYRAYLGLIVPKGDVGMKICGETLHWHEGEILILDHTFPHCPHNHTNGSRVVLVIDFYQPDKKREDMEKLEHALITERMKTNPHGFGVFGDEDYVSDEVLKKYGFEEQLNWKNLSAKV